MCECDKSTLSKNEVTLLRRGGITRTKHIGFNFTSEYSPTTYADIIDKDVKCYAVDETIILDLSDNKSDLKKFFIHKLNTIIPDVENVDKEDMKLLIENAKKIIHDDFFTYLMIEENGLDILAKAYGFKGMLYWEWGDVVDPTTYLIFEPLKYTRPLNKISCD